MKLEFEKIILRDFKEYRGKHVLPLGPLGLGLMFMRGTNRVDPLGSNGAGKSSIWDAFSWAITGRTTRGLRGTDVRTWEGKAHAAVSVTFYADDDGHVIKRSTEKNGLWLDGKLTSQEEIDRLLGLTVVNLPHTLILGQKRELFFDLKPSEKLEVLSETLNLDKWDARTKRARDQAHDLEIVLDVADQQVKTLTQANKQALETLEEQKAASSAWSKERTASDDKRQEEIDKLKKARERVVNAMGTHDLAYDGAETELRAIRRDILKRAEEMQPILDRVSKYLGERNATQMRIDALNDIEDVCPTCGQEIASKKEAKAHAKKELKVCADALEIANQRLLKWKEKKTELENVLHRMRDDEKMFGKRSDEAKDKFDQHKAQIAELDQSIAVLGAQNRSDEINPYAETIKAYRKLIEEQNAKLKDATETIDKTSRAIERTKYWVKGFPLVKLYLLQDVLEELQEVTQNILPDVGLDGWMVEYDIERETKTGSVATGLNVRILKPGTSKAVKWESWSGGENQRLLIAGALALSEVLLRHAGIECDMIVLDEPTRHMSKEGVNNLVDHLVSMGRDRQVFYCDHMAIESSRFAHVITITKDAKGSRIDVQ
jgi:DNA repair exonuclease SbcCD ATPase subunit